VKASAVLDTDGRSPVDETRLCIMYSQRLKGFHPQPLVTGLFSQYMLKADCTLKKFTPGSCIISIQ
jgi:hypothetical protein